MKVIAIIPARGGSKEVPQKNIKLLGDKPLIVYSIEAAKNSGVVDEVFVSTEDEKIARVAKEHGAKIIKRPMELAQDHCSSESALFHAIDIIEKEIKIIPEVIVFLQATSPFRNSEIVKRAVEKIYNEGYDSVLTAFPSYGYFWREEEGQFVPFRKIRQRRQEMLPWYCENGALYVIKTKVFKEVQNRYGGKIGFIEMSKEDSIEIDESFDWDFAEQLLKEKNKDN